MLTQNLVLRPNCLLTRAPLAFISGPRSLFSPQQLGQNLQQFLRAHGYQVAFLWMPFRSPKPRRKALQSLFEKDPHQKFHLVMPHQTWSELQELCIQFRVNISTITLIHETAERAEINSAEFSFYYFKNRVLPPLSYRLHQLFCWAMGSHPVPFGQTLLNEDKIIYDGFLDHCIDLAENE